MIEFFQLKCLYLLLATIIVPGPVLFSCGLKMGFLEFLNLNILLMFIQSQLRRNEKEGIRLKDKVSEMLAAFKKFNRSGWERWIESPMHELPSLGEMKNVLVVCGFLEAHELRKK